MPTDIEIQNVKDNLNNLINLNRDILINGNIKIENAFALLSMPDNRDLGAQVGINLLNDAFWAAGADGGPLGGFVASFCCGVLSDYSNDTPPSLQGSVSSLLERLQVTSTQFNNDLQKFYDDPVTYWDVVYSGNVVTAFGSYSVSGTLSDLSYSNDEVPTQDNEEYTKALVECVFGLDQVVWYNLLENFIITEYYPSRACYVNQGYTEQRMIDSANGWYINNPAYWRYWKYESAKGFWGGDKSAYWYNDFNIGSGWSPFDYGNLSDDACNYLFNDLYNGVPNPNVKIGGGLYAREFVFNDMPNIKRTTHTFSHSTKDSWWKKIIKLIKSF